MEVHFSGAAEAVRSEMRAWLGIESVQMIIPPAPKKGAKTEVSAPVGSEPTAAPTTVAPATGPITLDMVRDLVPLVAAKQGRPKAMELLAKYGAKKGNEVKEADWEKFIAEAKAMLA